MKILSPQNYAPTKKTPTNNNADQRHDLAKLAQEKKSNQCMFLTGYHLT